MDNNRESRDDSSQKSGQLITRVFAYKTGTFDAELPERQYKPIPKSPFKERSFIYQCISVMWEPIPRAKHERFFPL